MVRNNFWSNKRVFVTGATGLVGSNLVNKLLKMNAEVHAFIWETPRTSELVRSQNISRITLHYGNLSDKDTVENSIIKSNAEIIFHLGAKTIVSEALNYPEETLLTNIQGTWNVLESVRNIGSKIKCVIVASSDKAYGKPIHLPYSETHPLHGDAPYDVSKSCADLIAQSYAKTFGLPVAISRCGNIYGPGDTNWSRIVPGTFKSLILEKSRPIIRSNGLYLRDYIFVEDVVNAYLTLAEHYENLIPGSAFNFSHDRAYSVMEIYEQICLAALGKVIEPEVQNIVVHEIKEQHLVSHKAMRELGWRTNYELKEGLDLSAKWYIEFFKSEK